MVARNATDSTFGQQVCPSGSVCVSWAEAAGCHYESVPAASQLVQTRHGGRHRRPPAACLALSQSVSSLVVITVLSSGRFTGSSFRRPSGVLSIEDLRLELKER